VGERIKQARKLRYLSQRELAKRAEVSAQAISKYEREMNAPSTGVLLLSKALGAGVEFFVHPRSVVAITADYLLGFEVAEIIRMGDGGAPDAVLERKDSWRRQRPQDWPFEPR
jgi:transcriptional regulator with XRE-family HTH domain